MAVTYENISGVNIPYPERLSRLAGKVLSAEKDGNINLIFCNEQYIETLNQSFRKKNVPTDVLSFIYNELEILGEIYICPQIAKNQSGVWNNTFYRELRRLVVHGCLHLAGFKHNSPAEQKKFRLKEEFYLGMQKL